jgi:hypothetical protein
MLNDAYAKFYNSSEYLAMDEVILFFKKGIKTHPETGD